MKTILNTKLDNLTKAEINYEYGSPKMMSQDRYKEKDKSLSQPKPDRKALLVECFIDNFYNIHELKLDDFETIKSFISYGYKYIDFGDNINENILELNKLFNKENIGYRFKYNGSFISLIKI